MKLFVGKNISKFIRAYENNINQIDFVDLTFFLGGYLILFQCYFIFYNELSYYLSIMFFSIFLIMQFVEFDLRLEEKAKTSLIVSGFSFAMIPILFQLISDIEFSSRKEVYTVLSIILLPAFSTIIIFLSFLNKKYMKILLKFGLSLFFLFSFFIIFIIYYFASTIKI